MQRKLKFHFFDQLKSTQTTAKSLHLEKDTLHAISCLNQLEGRGTFGKKWLSSNEGGLYLTLAFHLDESVNASTLSLLASTSVCLELKHLNPKIKWPNDILVASKKISGVMTEVDADKVYVGIGVNLKLDEKIITGLDKPATSWHLFEKPPESFELAERVSNRFLELLEIWQKKGFKAIVPLYESFFPLVGKKVTLELQEGLLSGTLKGFSDVGFPILEIGTLEKTFPHVKHINLEI